MIFPSDSILLFDIAMSIGVPLEKGNFQKIFLDYRTRRKPAFRISRARCRMNGSPVRPHSEHLSTCVSGQPSERVSTSMYVASLCVSTTAMSLRTAFARAITTAQRLSLFPSDFSSSKLLTRTALYASLRGADPSWLWLGYRRSAVKPDPALCVPRDHFKVFLESHNFVRR